ncbi:hypothetical protein C8F01DRAFT_83499 [Mycena amicta]|nr:hypothetical protein C8F01DRAFT_83499 [Mycena amicta]
MLFLTGLCLSGLHAQNSINCSAQASSKVSRLTPLWSFFFQCIRARESRRASPLSLWNRNSSTLLVRTDFVRSRSVYCKVQ